VWLAVTALFSVMVISTATFACLPQAGQFSFANICLSPQNMQSLGSLVAIRFRLLAALLWGSIGDSLIVTGCEHNLCTVSGSVRYAFTCNVAFSVALHILIVFF